jgi:hypothetical protein
MTTTTLLGIFFGVAAIGIAAWLQSQLLTTLYRRGYEQGWKDSADYWLGIAKDVEEMKKELRYEEEV